MIYPEKQITLKDGRFSLIFSFQTLRREDFPSAVSAHERG